MDDSLVTYQIGKHGFTRLSYRTLDRRTDKQTTDIIPKSTIRTWETLKRKFTEKTQRLYFFTHHITVNDEIKLTAVKVNGVFFYLLLVGWHNDFQITKSIGHILLNFIIWATSVWLILRYFKVSIDAYGLYLISCRQHATRNLFEMVTYVFIWV